MNFVQLINHPGLINSLVAYIQEAAPILAHSPNWGMTRCMVAMLAMSADMPDTLKNNLLPYIVSHADEVNPDLSSEEGLKIFFTRIRKEILASPEVMEMVGKMEEAKPLDSFLDSRAILERLDMFVEH